MKSELWRIPLALLFSAENFVKQHSPQPDLVKSHGEKNHICLLPVKH